MIIKEWLEDIKERFVKYQTDYNLNGEDVEFLIQQAKKNELLNAEIETLQSKWEAQGLMIQKLHRENQRYKQALEFYAERDNYQWEVSYRPQQEIDCMVIDDSGHTARKALKGE